MENCKLWLIAQSTGKWRKYYDGVTNINNSNISFSAGLLCVIFRGLKVSGLSVFALVVLLLCLPWRRDYGFPRRILPPYVEWMMSHFLPPDVSLWEGTWVLINLFKAWHQATTTLSCAWNLSPPSTLLFFWLLLFYETLDRRYRKSLEIQENQE